MLGRLLCALVVALYTARGEPQCRVVDYKAAAHAHANPSAQPLAGFTRSVVRPWQFTLLTPESRVYAGPPPGWTGPPASAAAVVTPALGAHFTMYLVDAPPGAAMARAVSYDSAPSRLERLLYVLHGAVDVRNTSSGSARTLGPGGFAYYAPGDDALATEAGVEGAHFILIDRLYNGPGGAQSVVGAECDVEEELCAGEVFKLRRLLDKNDATLDFNIHIMDFEPGEYLHVKEVHYNQHGLLMLQGHGIYMLADTYFPVTAGDVIYMAPFVPQWYGALGKERSRYFLYKDTNVNPLRK